MCILISPERRKVCICRKRCVKKKTHTVTGVVRHDGWFSAITDVIFAAVDQIVQIGQNDAGVIFHVHTRLLSFGVEQIILYFRVSCKKKFVKHMLNLKNEMNVK